MIGLLCPGQGSQFVGMGRDLVTAFRTARLTFEEADDAIRCNLSRLCWEGPDEELRLTVNAQPAILTHSVAAWRVLQAEAPLSVVGAAGHSLGEFTAYVAAGSLRFADAVRLVRRRGELMYRSGQERPGAMAAVIGLDDAAVDAICLQVSADTAATVVAANYNSPGQLVISGDVEAVTRAGDLLREAGAKRVIGLNVSGAFHSPLMETAAPGLQAELETVELRDPDFPVVSNVTAEPVSGIAAARELLVRQLTSPVRWVQSMRTMRSWDLQRFAEVGPGSVLTGLLRRLDRSTTIETLGTATELEKHLREER